MAEDSDDECPVCAQKMILPTTVPGCGHKFCFLCIKGAVFRTNEHLCPMCRGEVSTSIFRSPAIRGINLDMHDPESPSVAARSPISKSDGAGSRLKRARVSKRACSDEAGPSTSSKKREQFHEQESESCQNEPNSEVAHGDGRFYWLYEGCDGWWRFDPRLEKDLENGRRSEKHTVELIVCGFMYEVDYEQMVQYRKGAPRRKRKIKRVSEAEFQEISNKGIVKGISGVRLARK
uniref:E3 ubiquitin-protein ligase n=1 Tax=Haemonchus contortus TaxID=6289 RepID=A0A7I5E5H6_HAECO|nr:Zinc finger and WWE domain containing protein [Haemonchus contortus]